MILMTIDKISKSYLEKKLIQEITFGINKGDKIGLIGINGTGKSTLLKILAGVENPDSGEITKTRNLKLAYLPQHPEFDKDGLVLDQVFAGEWPQMLVLREYNRALEKSSNQEILIDLSQKMDFLSAWDLESKAKSILNRLGISNYNEKIENLSGGQKKRVALARALIQPSDILILDEPTNHLDNETIQWLEDLLRDRKGASIMVTHDRYFLDRVANTILELDGGDLFTYKGNYSYYIKKKLEREDSQRAFERKRKSLYKKELAWMMQGAKARSTKQKARRQRFEELKESSTIQPNHTFDISVTSSRLGKKIINLYNIEKAYDNVSLIKDFSYTVLRDDRIGILGNNGTGKTTLLKIINGEISPDSGIVEYGETVNIGFFKQETPFIDDDIRAIDYIKQGGESIKTNEGILISASEMLERFMIPSEIQYSPLNKLSGGEKRRLYLLRVLMQAPNVLLMDEPTNDLDIETLQILEEYIEDFPGPVIIVSHDRYMLNKISEKIFVFENSKINGYTGNYDFFMKTRGELCSPEIKQKSISTQKPKVREKKEKLKFSFNENREWETIEDDINKLEESLLEVEHNLVREASNYQKLQEIIKEKEILEKKLEEKMERWLYLQDKAEKINNISEE